MKCLVIVREKNNIQLYKRNDITSFRYIIQNVYKVKMSIDEKNKQTEQLSVCVGG